MTNELTALIERLIFFETNARKSNGRATPYSDGLMRAADALTTLREENARLRKAVQAALLWTDEENDVGRWRNEASAALSPHKAAGEAK